MRPACNRQLGRSTLAPVPGMAHAGRMTISSYVLAVTGFGHMDGWGWGMGMGIVGLLVLLLVVGLVTWLIVSGTQRPGSRGGSRSALDVLDERYARGEIDRNDYLERRADLEERT